ncbi:hypothetical protein TRVL_06397 [Trypanosoma vivax]|nr:hypothetical protein TRVL_06397 [Trypanosoma vivax]
MLAASRVVQSQVFGTARVFGSFSARTTPPAATFLSLPCSVDILRRRAASELVFTALCLPDLSCRLRERVRASTPVPRGRTSPRQPLVPIHLLTERRGVVAAGALRAQADAQASTLRRKGSRPGSLPPVAERGHASTQR